MIYKAIMPKHLHLNLLISFENEYDKIKTTDIGLLCNFENPLEEVDKEFIFYVYGTKTEMVKEFLEKFKFKSCSDKIDNLYLLVGHFRGVVKSLERH